MSTNPQAKDESGPIWIVEEDAPAYPDGRFDGVTTIPPLNPNQPTPEVCDACGQTATNAYHYHDGIGGCEFCCPICQNESAVENLTRELQYTRTRLAGWKLRYESSMVVVDAARLAVPNIETVFRLYGHTQTHPLPELRALHALFTPPAPAWQAKEKDEL